MTEQYGDPSPASSGEPDETVTLGKPTLAEDLLLLLFQPNSGLQSGTGSIAGEGTLFYVLAGAVLADLGLGDHVRTGTGRMGTTTVEAVADNPPSDHLLRASWEYVADKPRGVQTVLAATGPTLREPLLDRLIERGDLRRSTRKALGLFHTSVLAEGDSGRRDGLLADVRAVLVDGAEPTPRVVALAALLNGSGTLPQFDRDIPWTSLVIARAEELKNGNWGAGAAAEAVARTVTATIVNNVIIAAAVLPRG
ncbi:GOLPH3/VPS74 family protein [Actinopolymorpha alba]|uniref:GOLPH3/VPS74 family protein n=1 Tax=Actinopolymorpha alba TaxID=533267 RepID=UPI0009FE5EE5|nr:GPP34 family phosphoprotein [Actinopolymorpha alba]